MGECVSHHVQSSRYELDVNVVGESLLEESHEAGALVIGEILVGSTYKELVVGEDSHSSRISEKIVGFR